MTSTYYLVAGLGKTGHSIARYLRRRDQPFAVFDTRAKPPNALDFQKEFPGVPLYLEQIPEGLLDQITAIITSPGISLNEPFIKEAKRCDIPIWGDIECLAQAIAAPVIAITGTNGKSTVTTLVGDMAKADGVLVSIAGNIGTPVLDALDDGHAYDLWVLELSSFQLDVTHSLKPLVATVLNITPDHLDRHETLKAYTLAKQRVYRQAQYLIYNRDDAQTIPNQDDSNVNSAVISYGLTAPKPGTWGLLPQADTFDITFGSQRLMSVDALRIKGQHNWQNALAACALAHAAGISFAAMKDVLQRFSGLPHRSQWVRTINGVDFINDSKGTNVGATTSAITGIGGFMQGKIVLIAGGLGKGADFSDLKAPIAAFVRSVVLMGQDADRIQAALQDVVPTVNASSMAEAVKLAQSQAQAGDVVLLSPACASQDMFKDFNQRGDWFASAVKAL